MKGIKLIAVALSVLLTGCVTNQSMYTWGKYEDSLYKYYKKPDSLEAYVATLESVVVKGEAANNVPPGIYAETGFAHLTSGNSTLAIEYFEKEKSKWPESTMLMDIMISNAKGVSNE